MASGHGYRTPLGAGTLSGLQSRREDEYFKRSQRRNRSLDCRRRQVSPPRSRRLLQDYDGERVRSRSCSEQARGRYRGRGGRGRGARVKKDHVSIRSLTVSEIIYLSTLQPHEIVSRLSNDAKAFQHTLEQDQMLATEPGIMITLVDILLKVVQCLQVETASQHQARQILAEVLSERCSIFHLSLKQHIMSTLKKSDQLLAQLSLLPPVSSLSQAQSLCKLFRALLNALPTSSGKCLPVDELAHALGQTSLFSSLDAEVQEIVKLYDEIKEDAIKKKQAQNSELVAGEEWDNEEFRKEPILPKWEEISRSDPPSRLRANIITGSYTDWNHYYDIHFRLLREDFIAPLRRGVCQFLQGASGSMLKDVKVYHHVKIIEPICTRSGICYTIQFDVSRMQHCNWEHSKRLIFGSLLCLSPDSFQGEIFFAVVSNSDSGELKHGKLQIQMEEGKNILPYCKKATFTMVESLVYFEASKHILHSLQTAEVHTMPFTEYLIENQCNSVSSPRYLEHNGVSASAVYDLRFLRENNPADTESFTLCPPTHCSAGSILSRSSSTSYESMEYDSDLETKGRIDILDPNQWIHTSDIELDASQLQAIQMALTQEIAVIQGPPGTGKTYIGLKIVEALLRNRKVWDPNENSPILVMCFTNHALDQFLEGIIQNPNLDTQIRSPPIHQSKITQASIVRVGGRSQSELVKKYSIKEKREHVHVPQVFDRARKSCEAVRHFQADGILKARSKYQKMARSFLPLSELEDYVDRGHLNQLLDNTETGLPLKKQKEHALQIWLGLAKITKVNAQPSPQMEDDYSEMEDKCVLMPHSTQGYGITMQPSSHSRYDDLDAEDKEHCDKESFYGAELIDIKEEVTMEESARILDSDVDDFKPLSLPQHWSQHHQFSDIRFSQQSDPKLLLQQLTRMQDENEDFFQSELVVQDVEWASKLFQWGIKQPPMSKQEVQEVLDVNQLTKGGRWSLYNYWVTQLLFNLNQQSSEEFKKYNHLCTKVKQACQQCDRFIMETADVIGMTTTGAAKNQHILYLVKPKIVIVEEAAEVLESHIVSALNAGTQHLILIGDHKQLRPKPNEYNLAKKYKLDVSLFERLVRNGFPRATLQTQHRMRPQIARLVHPHIYDTLINHESVLKYEDVKGVVHNLFFLQHSFPEKEDANLINHSNPHEARYLAALCKYLLQQGYKPTQITILVTYIGQLHTMRKELTKERFLGVKLTTVDNFQGEENDIILLSLVRSNPEESIGFLKEESRVCVALSRARMGLYCIGNFNMLRGKAPIWEKILSDMESRGYLGDALPLYCVNHPNTKCAVKMPADFKANAPNGGCTKDCDCRLGCGHVCVNVCHSEDPVHTMYQCRMPCTRKCEHDHPPCEELCYAPCTPCEVPMHKVFPDCGHEQVMYCCDDPMDKRCRSPCPKKCPSGHACPEKCWKKVCSPCKVEVNKVVPNCGHEQRMLCHVDPATFKCQTRCKNKCPNGHPCTKRCYRNCGHNVKRECNQAQDPEHYLCNEKCNKKLPCGHKCIKKCYEECIKECKFPIEVKCPHGHINRVPCFSRSQPVQCSQRCDVVLICGHRCEGCCFNCHITRVHNTCKFDVILQHFCGHTVTVNCTDLKEYPSHPSPNQCRMKCPHRECSHDCSKSCEPCTEPCPWQCPHHRCEKRCHEICDRPSCKKRCPKMLRCGEHRCYGLCGEPCLRVCPFCDKKQFTKMLKQVKHFNRIEPHVQLDCGHIFTAEFMDNYVYSKPTLATPVVPKECPECGQALVASFRYGTVVKHYIQDVSVLHVIIESQHERNLTEEDKSTLLSRLQDGLKHFFIHPKLKHFVELETLLSTSSEELITPQMAFIIELTVICIELFRDVKIARTTTTIEGEYSSADQLYYLKRLEQEYSQCTLSLQSSEDLISEQYRLALMIQYSAGYNADTATDLTPTRELLEELAKDSSRRLTKDEYTIHSKLLEAHVASTDYCNYQLVHEAPMCLKVQWLSCSRGHCYSVPLHGEPVREQKCQKCKGLS